MAEAHEKVRDEDLTTEEALVEARKHLANVANGGNPQQKKQARAFLKSMDRREKRAA